MKSEDSEEEEKWRSNLKQVTKLRDGQLRIELFLCDDIPDDEPTATAIGRAEDVGTNVGIYVFILLFSFVCFRLSL